MSMNYKTPMKKLLKFFEDSRDKWKLRALEKQKRIEQLEIKVRDITNSRDTWKKKYMEGKASSKKCPKDNSDNQSHSKELMLVSDDENLAAMIGEVIPKKDWPQIDPWSRPTSHMYSLCTIHIAMELVLFSHNSFRAAMKSFQAFAKYNPVEIPSWVTIENWILRFGLYELQKPKEKRNDRIWIMDHTIQAGKQKGFVILGITNEYLQQLSAISMEKKPADVVCICDGFNLSHQDVQVLKIAIDEHENGAIVHQHLNDLAEQIGVPVQIISDHGSDLKKGIDLFIEDHSDTCYTYDITHEIGLLLKKLLENDPEWKKFSTWCGTVRQKVLQTELGFLAPPCQKSKSRYLNLAPLIAWGGNLLEYQGKSDFNQINPDYNLDHKVIMDIISEKMTDRSLQIFCNQTYSTPEEFIAAIEEKIGAEKVAQFQKVLLEPSNIGKQRFDEYFGGISKFKKIISNFVEVMDIIKLVEKQVKNEGLNNKSATVFSIRLKKLDLSNELSNKVAQGIIQYLEIEGKNVPQDQTLLSTSDIIESIFGKYKLFVQNNKLQGIGKLILTIPAFTADISLPIIKKAFETVRSIDVKKWLDDNLGPSLLAKRRQTLNSK